MICCPDICIPSSWAGLTCCWLPANSIGALNAYAAAANACIIKTEMLQCCCWPASSTCDVWKWVFFHFWQNKSYLMMWSNVSSELKARNIGGLAFIPSSLYLALRCGFSSMRQCTGCLRICYGGCILVGCFFVCLVRWLICTDWLIDLVASCRVLQ